MHTNALFYPDGKEKTQKILKIPKGILHSETDVSPTDKLGSTKLISSYLSKLPPCTNGNINSCSIGNVSLRLSFLVKEEKCEAKQGMLIVFIHSER